VRHRFADGRLVDSLAAAAGIAIANAALQAETLAKTHELESSSRRVVEAIDAQN
jgi:hypothetical protein